MPKSADSCKRNTMPFQNEAQQQYSVFSEVSRKKSKRSNINQNVCISAAEKLNQLVSQQNKSDILLLPKKFKAQSKQFFGRAQPYPKIENARLFENSTKKSKIASRENFLNGEATYELNKKSENKDIYNASEENFLKEKLFKILDFHALDLFLPYIKIEGKDGKIYKFLLDLTTSVSFIRLEHVVKKSIKKENPIILKHSEGHLIVDSFISAPLLKNFGFKNHIKFYILHDLRGYDGLLGRTAMKDLQLHMNFKTNCLSNGNIKIPFYNIIEVEKPKTDKFQLQKENAQSEIFVQRQRNFQLKNENQALHNLKKEILTQMQQNSQLKNKNHILDNLKKEKMPHKLDKKPAKNLKIYKKTKFKAAKTTSPASICNVIKNIFSTILFNISTFFSLLSVKNVIHEISALKNTYYKLIWKKPSSKLHLNIPHSKNSNFFSSFNKIAFLCSMVKDCENIKLNSANSVKKKFVDSFINEPPLIETHELFSKILKIRKEIDKTAYEIFKIIVFCYWHYLKIKIKLKTHTNLFSCFQVTLTIKSS